jgi:succinate dehydrogenase/fumarate reductase flavoprotein subunit
MTASGYTAGMKTAISVPDKIFKEAERYARRVRKSRSALYSEALAEYLARHAPDAVTDALDQVCRELDSQKDKFSRAAGRRILTRTPW